MIYRHGFACGLLSIAMGLSSAAAYAQGDRDRHQGPGDMRDRGGDARRDEPRRDRDDADRGPDMRRDVRDDRRDHDGPGAGPDHNFYRGQRLAPEYRNRQYVVDDWRGHHLSAPPRGYQWVQTGGDYVLVAVATGIIASILLNH